MSKNVQIVTKTDKGEVRTSFSDDPFHNYNSWQSSLIVQDSNFPIAELVDALYADSYEEAGRNHLKLCERIK
jgi:hypothetical protein